MTRIIEFLFSISRDTAVTLIVTLIVFTVGIIIAEFIKGVNNYRNRRNYRRIFKEMLSEISDSSIIQSENFKKFTLQLDTDYEGHFSMPTKNIDLLYNFRKISFETFYNSYFNGIENLKNRKKLESFNITFGTIDYLVKSEDFYHKQLKEFNDTYNQHLINFNDELEKARFMYENIFVSINGKQLPEEINLFYKTFEGIISKWQNKKKTLPSFTYNKLIKPLLDFANEDSSKIFIQNHLTLINSLSLAAYHYKNIEKTFDFYQELFNNYALQYRNAGELLKEINNKLN